MGRGLLSLGSGSDPRLLSGLPSPAGAAQSMDAGVVPGLGSWLVLPTAEGGTAVRRADPLVCVSGSHALEPVQVGVCLAGQVGSDPGGGGGDRGAGPV